MQTIQSIDRQIDAVRAELCRRETVDQLDAGSWQRAWDRQPGLAARERRLFARRDAVRFPGAAR